MDAIQIQGLTADEFFQRLQQVLPVPATTTDPNEADWLIDRAFIMRNLKLSRRKIEQYEQAGSLRRISIPSDLKGAYYRMSDFRRIYETELNEIRTNR